MADPVSMAVAGMGASAGGGIFGAIGQMMGGQANAAMYQYQAGIAQMNAKIAAQNAEYATLQGEAEAGRQGLKTREQIGKTITDQSASGLQVGAGSAGRVVSSEAEIGSYDQAVIRNNAAWKAYGFQVQGVEDTAQAQMDQYAASYSKEAGTIGAIGSLLGGVSSVSSKWSQGRQMGLFG
jgi:hypothetical protein